MKIELEKEELEEQQSLIFRGRMFQQSIKQAQVFHNLLTLRHRLVSREQDVWLLRFALVHGIPVSEIKNFAFTREGEVSIGEDHEPTSSILDGEAGRGETSCDEGGAEDHQAGDQDHPAQDGG